MAKKKGRKSRASIAETIRQNAAQTDVEATYKGSDFNPDYSDVYKDLKRIGLLAGIFLAVMVTLSFFI
jgi:hypothetical protein